MRTRTNPDRFHSETERALTVIPGVGKSIARDLVDLGIRRVRNLRGRDPERLYERLCALRGVHVDRCMLYVLRCAVYYAGTARPDPRLLLWWNWKHQVPSIRRTGSVLRGKITGRHIRRKTTG